MKPRMYDYECPKCKSRIPGIKGSVTCKCGASMVREDEWRRKRYYEKKAMRNASRPNSADA